MKWKCKSCGEEHDELPICFGFHPPWSMFVEPDEFEDRVALTEDTCIIDDDQFFIRGNIKIPILKHDELFEYSVWSSLSAEDYAHATQRWDEPDRHKDPPYAGQLMTPIAGYPDTLKLKLKIQTQPCGFVPLITLEKSQHPLALEQLNGISIARWHEIAEFMLHPPAKKKRKSTR